MQVDFSSPIATDQVAFFLWRDGYIDNLKSRASAKSPALSVSIILLLCTVRLEWAGFASSPVEVLQNAGVLFSLPYMPL
jgi:hypothetical protein